MIADQVSRSYYLTEPAIVIANRVLRSRYLACMSNPNHNSKLKITDAPAKWCTSWGLSEISSLRGPLEIYPECHEYKQTILPYQIRCSRLNGDIKISKKNIIFIGLTFEIQNHNFPLRGSK